jgi:hypothetical protein
MVIMRVPWLSRYVRQRWDVFQLSSTCCQTRVDSCGHISSHQAINDAASQDPGADRAYPLLKAPGQGDWMPRPIPGRGGRRNEQPGCEIVPAHVYHNEGRRRCGLHPGLVLFKLLAPPLQPRVVGPYPVRGVWFPIRLLLEGTGRIQNYGS